MKSSLRLKRVAVAVAFSGYSRNFVNQEQHLSCKKVLGQDYISLDDILGNIGWAYPEKTLAKLVNTFPDSDTLESLYSNQFSLIPGPPVPLNFLLVTELMHYRLSVGKDFNLGQSYLINDFVQAGVWYMVRLGSYPDSYDLAYKNQTTLLGDSEYIPNVAELAWIDVLLSQVQKLNLFEHFSLRTSSVSDHGNQIVYQGIGGRGITLIDNLDNSAYKGVGVASAVHVK